MSTEGVLTNQPVVIDNGSGVLKAGFAGDEKPKNVFQSIVGRPKHVRLMAGALEGDFFIGAKAEEYRGLLKLKYPIEHGIVTDWGDMERIWNYTFNELHVHSEEHPVLLTEAPLNPITNKERAAQLFFETFSVPALHLSLQAVLSLYASGRTTGAVLDSGDGVTHAVPIFEGFSVPSAIRRMDLAGRDITYYLRNLLRRNSGNYFYTSAEMETVRLIKEQVCFVALDAGKQEELMDSGNLSIGAAKGATSGGGSGGAGNAIRYTLPDGNIINIGAERFRAPEALFRPELIGEEYPGIHELVLESIQKADLDLRKTLFGNIVLSGGSTKFAGFGARLLDEIKTKGPKEMKIKISAPKERENSTWVGGSILASLPTFSKMWISRTEYEEEGVSIVHKKTFS